MARRCIFCTIARGEEPKTTLLHEDERFVAFQDRSPGAPHHYLIIPKEHIGNPATLTNKDIPLVESLAEVGNKVLQEQGGNMEDKRLGFHWPPFNSINHLHLHVLSPTSQMGFLSRLIYRPAFYFVTVDSLLQRLQAMPVDQPVAPSSTPQQPPATKPEGEQ
ncbi:PREDICTED: histidine triad nucleotide-binding protein 3-like [Branchiostoma belcheri]|uniref:Adenosine 5'-monophosphoramidase HINT3 n=1 Tax=Branchiostoma belcheri TaxID=7741 RepID=A0A6P4ZVK1_BRABE|nr:PREDICTED: histidine triad nucleotide-binding protein 3-like [Branchiostoma belcheri]